MNVGANGTFSGAFFGPKANEVGGVWNVSDGTRTAAGGFAAAQQTPSDRRLKHDIRLIATRADGLRLYGFRYVGDDQDFVGVMAQDLIADPRFAGAVVTRPSGLMVVDYARLGLDELDTEAMRRAGFAAIALFEAKQAA
jgi:hypothetical protein